MKNKDEVVPVEVKNMKTSFKKFGGEHIPNIVEYLKEYIEKDPNLTISVGCDSVQRRRKTQYAITIVLYNGDIKNGGHIIFFRENLTKIANHFERLQKEALFALELAEMLDGELSSFYKRSDLVPRERKRYKFHLLKCAGKHSEVPPHVEDSFINALTLTESEKTMDYRLVDIHVDFNPSEGHIDKKGVAKNKSNMSYKANVSWLRSLGFRVFAKPLAFASTSAADLLLQD